jgi:hypothetical protein
MFLEPTQHPKTVMLVPGLPSTLLALALLLPLPPRIPTLNLPISISLLLGPRLSSYLPLQTFLLPVRT